jgi:Fe-S-cluster-containing hydrogenase component 2
MGSNKKCFMRTVYKRLAEKLDQIPNGFPATDTGVELRLLQRVFSPEDAELALQLEHAPETVAVVAKRIGKSIPETRETLDRMVEKGQIGSVKASGKQIYMLYPFIIGLYEFRVNKLDQEFVELFEEYIPRVGLNLGAFKPALQRVVPVNQQIEGEEQVHRYEDLRRRIEEARSFQVMECICRQHQAIKGNPCKHTYETCLGFSDEEGAYDRHTHGRVIAKEEALKIIEKAADEGLVHCTYNVESGIGTHVCNCCSCCCGTLNARKIFGRNAPGIIAVSNYFAGIDGDECQPCGECEERCPMDAIHEKDGAYHVMTEKCIGCGVCTITCPMEAITLSRKAESEHEGRPPVDMNEWNIQRASNRGIEFGHFHGPDHPEQPRHRGESEGPGGRGCP